MSAVELEHADAELDTDDVVIHVIYEDAVDSEAWGVLPGTALCGFVFTTENDLGPAECLPRSVGALTEACAECLRVSEAHHLEAWFEGLL